CSSTILPPIECSPSLEQVYKEQCQILTTGNGPFIPCHAHIPPQSYFESCVYDLCANNGSFEQLCQILESYASACQVAGVHLGDWRKETV
ncbi:hypothetical protein NDU88_000107, partial [Pleurodeles waltl]